MTTHSAHYIAHPGLRRAVEDYLERERREVSAVHDALEEAARSGRLDADPRCGDMKRKGERHDDRRASDTPGMIRNNIFAKILRGEIPCHKVYEDEATLAFMDIMPIVDGHCLVIPKAPARNIFDVDAGRIGPLVMVARTVSLAACRAFEADGHTLRLHSEASGGQEVFHVSFPCSADAHRRSAACSGDGRSRRSRRPCAEDPPALLTRDREDRAIKERIFTILRETVASRVGVRTMLLVGAVDIALGWAWHTAHRARLHWSLKREGALVAAALVALVGAVETARSLHHGAVGAAPPSTRSRAPLAAATPPAAEQRPRDDG